MTAYNYSLKGDELLARAHLLKRLNVSCHQFIKLMHTGPIPFPKPVLTLPHARWSAAQVDLWINQVAELANQPKPSKYEVVLLQNDSPSFEYEYEHAFNLARKVVAEPELLAYFKPEMFNESYPEPPGVDWTDWAVDHLWSGSPLFHLIPRHHPKLVAIVKSIPPEERCGYVVQSIPYSSYKITRHELSDNEYILDQSGDYDVNVIPKPGEEIFVKCPVVPKSHLDELVEKYSAGTNIQLQLLLADIKRLIFQE